MVQIITRYVILKQKRSPRGSGSQASNTKLIEQCYILVLFFFFSQINMGAFATKLFQLFIGKFRNIPHDFIYQILSHLFTSFHFCIASFPSFPVSYQNNSYEVYLSIFISYYFLNFTISVLLFEHIYEFDCLAFLHIKDKSVRVGHFYLYCYSIK